MRYGLLILCFVMSSAWADMITKVIPLHYVDAAKLLPLLTPLVKPGETVTGQGQNLVLSVSPETLTKLSIVITQLDVMPVTFIVRIHQGPDNWLDSQNSDVVNYGTVSRDNQSNDQSIEVMNGQSAMVSTGQNVPVLSQVQNGGVLLGPRTAVGGVFAGVSYDRAQITQGFEVLPTLQGEKVLLKIKRIRGSQDEMNQQQINDQSFSTTTLVPQNTWVKLSSASENHIDSGQDSVHYEAGSSTRDATSLYIQVELRH